MQALRASESLLGCFRASADTCELQDNYYMTGVRLTDVVGTKSYHDTKADIERM